jgi:hypothetical protein
LVSVEHIVVGYRRHAYKPIFVTLCPVAGMKCYRLLWFGSCAYDGYAQGMSTGAAGYADYKNSGFFPE